MVNKKLYIPTVEEIQDAIVNARRILEQLFVHVTPYDVAKFRSLMRDRLEKYYRKEERIRHK